MKMINIRRYGLGLLLILGVVLHVPALGHGATGYEASNVTFSDPVTTGQYVRLTSDLIVSWNAPTDAAKVMNYYLLFNTSGAALTDQQLNDTTNDFAVDGALESKTIASTFFNAYDSNNIRYLHIKTQYATTTGGFAYSDDVVVGPIRIDNVAPTGTITLDPSAGSSTQITVSISPSEPIQYFWLSEAATFPGGTGSDGTFTSATWNLQATDYGAVPIYAWFQDYAGNRSSAASATATYDFRAPVAINYNAPNNQMNAGDSIIFTVDGSTTYNWTLTPSASGVAEITGGDTTTTKLSATSITVKGKAAGTFTLSAEPTAGGTTLTTSTITVVQTVKPGDCNNDGIVTITDVKMAFSYFVGGPSTSLQFAAANVYDDGDGNTSIKIHDVKGVFTLFLGGTL